MQNGFYVYEHIRLDTMKPFYVGKGIGPRAYRKAGRNQYWDRVANKHGFIINMVAENLDEDMALLVEIEKINQLRRLGIELTNMTDGGEGTSGRKHSEETRQKISNAHNGKTHHCLGRTGESHPMFGKKHSDEARLKISESMKNCDHPLFGKKGEDHPLFGKKRSEYIKNKISLGRKGKPVKLTTCPYCKTIGAISPMKRWHFDNCKNRKD